MKNIISKEFLQNKKANVLKEKEKKTGLLKSIEEMCASLSEKKMVHAFELARLNGELRLLDAMIAEVGLPEIGNEQTVQKKVKRNIKK